MTEMWSLNGRMETFKAAKNGDLQVIKDAIEKGFPINSAWCWTKGGEFFDLTLLEVAQRHNQHSICEYLISQGAKSRESKTNAKEMNTEPG